MPKTKSEKQAVVKEIAENLKKSKMVVLSDFKGLKVKEITSLRRELSQNNSVCQVVKKTIMNLAFKEASFDYDANQLQGNIIGLSFDFDENLAPAKIITKFNKTHEALVILGGFLENTFVDAKQIKILASLPSREELLAKLVGSIQAPLSGFVSVLVGNLRGLARVLNGRREVLEKI